MKKIIFTILFAFAALAGIAQKKDEKIIHHHVGGLKTTGYSKSVHFDYADTLTQSSKETIVAVKQKNGKVKYYHYPQGQSISVDYIDVFIQE